MKHHFNKVLAVASVVAPLVGAPFSVQAQSNQTQPADKQTEQAEKGSTAGGKDAGVDSGQTAADPNARRAGRAARLQDSECMQGLMETRGDYRGASAQASGADFRILGQAAREFAILGQEEACQNVVAGMQELKQQEEEVAKRAEERGIERDTVRRMEKAVPTTELTGGVRASEVIGMDLRNMEDENLGEVNDVILNAKDGSIRFVLVIKGGFLGIGEDWVPVPWKQLRVSQDMDDAYLPISEEAFENAPKVTREQVSADDDGTWSQEIDRYFEENAK